MKKTIPALLILLVCAFLLLTSCSRPDGNVQDPETSGGPADTSSQSPPPEPVTRTEPVVSGDYAYTLENSLATITSYTGSAAELTIPETLDGFPVVAIGRMAFANHEEIVRLTVPGCVTRIGDFAFYHCGSLVSVALGDGVQTIGRSSFNACRSLAEVSHTGSLDTVDEIAFQGCGALTEFDLEGVRFIGLRAFANSGLTSLKIPGSVKYLDNAAFLGCEDLASAEISAEISYLPDYLFAYCSSLQSVLLPETLNILGEYSFYRCTALETLRLPAVCYRLKDFSLFGCTSLQTIFLLYDGSFRIQEDALEFLPALKTIYYAGSSDTMAGWQIESSNYALGAAEIVYGFAG